jgi:hypothetical protein
MPIVDLFRDPKGARSFAKHISAEFCKKWVKVCIFKEKSMYFSEIDFLPRSGAGGLKLALAKHCTIHVYQTTIFSAKVRRRAGLQLRARRSLTKKSADILPKYRIDSDARTYQAILSSFTRRVKKRKR